MKKAVCYTYFMIIGDFEPDDITAHLGLKPFQVGRAGDPLPNGRRREESMWCFGRCDTPTPYLAEQMLVTITPLLDRTDVLRDLHEHMAVSYYLEVVPYLHEGEPLPVLSPGLSVIDFCYATRTEIDYDVYVIGEE